MTTLTNNAADPTPTSRRRPSRSRGAAQWRHWAAPYLFISPFFVLFIAFLLGPILIGAYLSFTQWAGFGSPEPVGLANYERLFGDSQFYLSLLNTVFFVLVSLLVIVPTALLVAQALHTRNLRGRDIFRVIYFTPIVLSPIVVVLVFQLFFDQNFGLINATLSAVFGLGGIDWLGDPWWARISVAILVAWRWTGYLVIFFLAGLNGVPRDLHEAAEIDGAGPVMRFRMITLPALKPVTAFVLVTSMVGTAQLFDEPYLLTQGGPNNATLTAALFIYRAGFQRQEIGYASAAGVVLFVVVFALGQIANRLLGVGRSSS